MIRKQPLDPRRLRSRPPRGFGWLDHRLLRQGYLARCSPSALALYCLLVCAGDDHGLSFYSDPSVCSLLRLEPALLPRVRRELMELGLIAFQRPLYQVLALSETAPEPVRSQAPAAPPAPSDDRPLALRAQAPASSPEDLDADVGIVCVQLACEPESAILCHFISVGVGGFNRFVHSARLKTGWFQAIPIGGKFECPFGSRGSAPGCKISTL